MIYTITLNPSVDYYMELNEFAVGEVNRSKGERYGFGGKGINVSRMLHTLGCESQAIAVLGGFTGKALAEGIQAEGINIRPIYTSGTTRINVKLNGCNTELNGSGANADKAAVSELKKLLFDVEKGDIVILSGSVCKGFDKDIYGKLVENLNRKEAVTIVDAQGELLFNAVESKPYLIKPNHIELGQLFNVNINSEEQAKLYAKRLIKQGVKNVLVSMGSKGAIFVNDNDEIFCAAPSIKAVNTVGAGDCLLAGFVHGITRGEDNKNCLSLAVACGSAKAAVADFPKKADINAYFSKL